MKLLGIALAAVIILAMTGCKPPGASDDNDDAINLKDFETTDTDRIIYKDVSNSTELQEYWESITAEGNYVINLTGNIDGDGGPLNLNDEGTPGNLIKISLRGAGKSISTGTFFLDDGETLILRDITLKGGGAVSCASFSKLFMEAGSAITGDTSLRIEDDGVFIMNGGEIYGNSSSDGGGGVTIKGGRTRFEKNPGGRIYDNTSETGFGQQVLILGRDGAPLAYRDEEITADETLTMTVNEDGNGIDDESGTWSKPE